MTRLRTAGSAGALLVVLAVFATACGGGGRLSARGYVTEASQICRQANRRVDHSDTVAQQAEAMSVAASALADLRPPESLVRFDAVWVALVRQSATELEAFVVSRRDGDAELADHQRAAVVTLTVRAGELAGRHGIDACPAPFAAVETGSVETGT